MILIDLSQRIFRKLCNSIFKSNAKLTIITGANSDYYETLINNLLNSISTFEDAAYVEVWDLGLTFEQIEHIRIEFPKIIIRHFDFEKFPKHYALPAQSYAWKSACIYESLKSCKTTLLFWLDAGCKLKGHLNAVRHIINRYGFYSPYSRTSILELTYPTILNHFDFLTDDIPQKRMLSGGIVGVKRNSPLGKRLIWEWYQLSKIPELIVPEGSNRSNHRQDQSLLSLLYYSHRKSVPVLARRVYDFLLHQRTERPIK